MYKMFIIILLLSAILSLGSALYIMFNSSLDRRKMARALTWRVVFSISLFGFLFLGAYFGLIIPHGLYPI